MISRKSKEKKQSFELHQKKGKKMKSFNYTIPNKLKKDSVN